VQGNILFRIAKKKLFVPRIATVNSLNLRADCQGVIPVVANRGTLESGLLKGYSCHGKPRYWSAVCHKRVNSSTSHFTSTPTVPLLVAPYFFNSRLYKCKTYNSADCLGFNYAMHQ
jgi:hypothetical protein